MTSTNYILNEYNVWSLGQPNTFTYSDGDEVEQRFLEQLQSAGDLTVASNELQRLIVDWPTEYHYSPLRGNILESFHFGKIGSVLEIGSGCGAITRFLGERDLQVLALDGSHRRAAITRARCRELDNVNVYCDTFENFTTEQKFDCATLIGVLEYSPAFISGKNPITSMLQKASQFLEKDGVLIIAIENQLGLKYFNGCGEDHSGQPFVGINDDYQSRRFCTLGRVELQKRLQEAGFSRSEFMYPFPDYKLPRVLVREQALISTNLNVGYIVNSYVSRDYKGRAGRVFHESRVWPLLDRNDLLRDLANSFLIIAFKGEAQMEWLSNDWLVRTYSCPRKKSFLTYNTFNSTKSGIFVDKNRLYPDEISEDDGRTAPLVKQLVGSEPYLPGMPYSVGLYEVIRSENSLRAYNEYLTPWVGYLIAEAYSNDSQHNFLQGRFLDCLPANLILANTSTGFTVFDQEWEYHSELDVGFVIFRGIYRDLENHLAELEETSLFADRSIFDVMNFVFEKHQIRFDQEILRRYVELEVDIQLNLIIYTASREELAEYLNGFILMKRGMKISTGALFSSVGLDGVANLQRELQYQKDESRKLRQDMIVLRKEIGAVKSTWSWKIGRFLTGLGRFLFRKS